MDVPAVPQDTERHLLVAILDGQQGDVIDDGR